MSSNYSKKKRNEKRKKKKTRKEKRSFHKYSGMRALYKKYFVKFTIRSPSQR
jgi:hypothetical protein